MLTFFLEGVIETAYNAYRTTDWLGRMFDEDRARIENRERGSAFRFGIEGFRQVDDKAGDIGVASRRRD